MKALLKVVLGLVGLAVLLGAGGLGFLRFGRPVVRAPSAEKVEPSAARLARGDYLVNNVLGCFGCHSEPDTLSYGFPPQRGSEGGGGECFSKESAGFPGTVCSQNLTPDAETGLGRWTDGEIIRATREGIDRDGNPILPIMPYGHFRALSDEDVKSVVAYLRTIQPIKRATPPAQVDFPVSFLTRLAPRPVDGPTPDPDRDDPLAYGKYLAHLACHDCHTPVDDQMNLIMEKSFAGGRQFKKSALVSTSANLTFHPTGRGAQSEDEFVGAFKAFQGDRMHVELLDNTVMPWWLYAGMEERDLRAIYRYLKTVPAHDNLVQKGR